MRVKELYKKYRREIWVGVVVSLITSAIVKFGDWLLNIAPTIGNNLFDTVSNTLYSLAATHNDNILLHVLLFGGFSILAAYSSKSIIDCLKAYKNAFDLELKCKKYGQDVLEEIADVALAEKINENKQIERKSVPELVQHGKKLGHSAIRLALMVLFAYLFMAFFITAPMTISNNFKSDIVKIAPYVEEYDVKKLQSDWVCMRSKADYDQIYEVIDGVKEAHKLPD